MFYDNNVIFKGNQRGTYFFNCVIKDKILKELIATQLSWKLIILRASQKDNIPGPLCQITMNLIKYSTHWETWFMGSSDVCWSCSYLCSRIKETSQFIKHFAFKNSEEKNLFN